MQFSKSGMNGKNLENFLMESFHNSQDFFEKLFEIYRDFLPGLGEAVNLATIMDFWQNNTAMFSSDLSKHENILALYAQHLCLDEPDWSPGWGSKNNTVQQNLLFSSFPVEKWPLQCEKLLLLLSPLICPRRAAAWINLSYDRIPAEKVKKEWLVQIGRGFVNWAKTLRQAEPWQAWRSELTACGGDPGMLYELLNSAEDRRWENAAYYIPRLFNQLALVTYQGIWLRGSDWPVAKHARLILELLKIVRGTSDGPVNYQQARQLKANLFLPLVNYLVSEIEVLEFAFTEADDDTLQNLLVDCGLLTALAKDPQQYRHYLSQLGELWKRLWLPASVVNTQKELAFWHIKERYGRTGLFTSTNLDLPETYQWYEEIIGHLERDHDVSECAKCLAPTLSSERALSLIEKHFSGNQRMPSALIKAIDNPAHLLTLLASPNDHIRYQAASEFPRLAVTKKALDDTRDYQINPHVWPQFIEASANHPDLFIDCTVSRYNCRRDRIDRWRLLWKKASSDEARSELAGYLLSYCNSTGFFEDADETGSQELAVKCYLENPTPFHMHLKDNSPDKELIIPIMAKKSPLWELVPEIVARYLMEPCWFSDPNTYDGDEVAKALVAYPKGFERLEERAKIKILPHLNAAAVTACGQALRELLACVTKSGQHAVVQLISRCNLATLEKSGLLQVTGKKARRILLNGIGLSETQGVLPLIKDLLNDKAHSDFTRGLFLDRLDAAGEDVSHEDPWMKLDIAQLQKEAAKQKVPAAVKKYWTPELATLLEDLGEDGGLALLLTLYQAEENFLPRRARQILSFLATGRRSDFVSYGVDTWVGENGSDKVGFFLLPLMEYGDERAANTLVKAVKSWKKSRKQKASAAIRLLCRLPGEFGAAQAKELWESRQFSDSIMRNAREALSDFAAQRGMTFTELLEVVVPDFGLTQEGLVLDVGPYSYTVKVKTDLSLSVLNSQGKAYKSLPKAKPEEDADKRSQAENRFKALKKNLKPVMKQQRERLTRSLNCGKTWPKPLWLKLFKEHALMAIIAQGVVWSCLAKDGKPLFRFRPSETGELINLDDDVVSLPEKALIRVTHPVEIESDEREAWTQHFADYEILSPCDQWEIPALQATTDELADTDVKRHSGRVINRARLGSLMQKWGYLKGDGQDGARFYEHYWYVDGDQWLVECTHEGIDVYFTPDESVTLEEIIPKQLREDENGDKRWQPIALGELPMALRSTLLNQSQALTDAAEVLN